jgi:tetratricopeptide (TPR) repeat protein
MVDNSIRVSLVGGRPVNQISLAEYRRQIEETIEAGRYEEAVAHGKHILEKYPKYIGAYWLLGKAMLEAGQDDQATDMLQRVLSADPEHMLAWVGMSEIAGRQDELEDAVWYLERAFELATDNETVADELRRLYGELEGSEPERLQLTQSALAKLYLRGDLLTRAITELRKLTEEHPERLDLKVSLIEALWRDGQRLQASQVCQEILEEQPYNLKANLILGEIWSSSERTGEAEVYLRRAEALDPENEMAQELFGSASPLPPKKPTITPLAYGAEAEAEEEEAAYMVALEEAAPAEPEEVEPAETEEAMEAEIEIPAWLQELAGAPSPEVGAEEPEEEEEPVIEAEAEAPAPVEAPNLEEPGVEEEREEPVIAEETAPEEMPDEDALDWLAELEREETTPDLGEEMEEEEIPAWLAELGGPKEEAIAVEEEGPEGAEPEPAEIPDWLQELAPPPAEPSEAVPPETPEEPAEPFKEKMMMEEGVEPGAEPEPEEALLEEVGLEEAEPEEAAPEEAAPEEAAPEEAAELPAWLESDEMPSGDDALAWLAQLAEGKEEELQAQAKAEGEARLAEIMGRSAAPVEEAVVEEEAEEEAEPEPVAAEDEAFGWTAFGEAEEAIAEEEKAVPPEEAAPEVPEDVSLVEEEAPPAEEPVPAAEVPPAADVVAPLGEAALEAPALEEEEEEMAEAPTEAPAAAAPELPSLIPTFEEKAPRVEEPEAPVPEEEEVARAPAAKPEAAPELPPLIPTFEEKAPPTEEPKLAVEVAAPVEEPEAPAPEEAEKAPAPAAAPEVPEVVPAAEEEAPLVEEPAAEEAEPVPAPEAVELREAPKEVSPAEAVEEPPTEGLEKFIAAQRAYTVAHPDDHEAQLDLARVLWQVDMRQDAVAAYEKLIQQNKLTDDVIADLEDYADQWSDAGLLQALGDAYMKADRLQDALDTYRQALASL